MTGPKSTYFEFLPVVPSRNLNMLQTNDAQIISNLPKGDENICEGLEGAECGKHDPIHHPFDLKKVRKNTFHAFL